MIMPEIVLSLQLNKYMKYFLICLFHLFSKIIRSCSFTCHVSILWCHDNFCDWFYRTIFMCCEARTLEYTDVPNDRDYFYYYVLFIYLSFCHMWSYWRPRATAGHWIYEPWTLETHYHIYKYLLKKMTSVTKISYSRDLQSGR